MYHPDRLVVEDPCKTVSGIVATVRVEADGDLHLDLALDPGQAALLNAGNLTDQHGQLVAEIVPADDPGCPPGQASRPAHGTYDYGNCTGANLAVPPLGAHVAVTGPYVFDADHGWMEIHPVWAIRAMP